MYSAGVEGFTAMQYDPVMYAYNLVDVDTNEVPVPGTSMSGVPGDSLVTVNSSDDTFAVDNADAVGSVHEHTP